MKAEMMDITAQDRPATSDEVRRAMSSTEGSLIELCHPHGNYCEMDSDLGGVIRYSAEEFEFFAYLTDMDEGAAN